MSDPDNWRVWLDKAANDLLNNRQQRPLGGRTVGHRCFHAQQAAEKLLKGLLVARG